MWIPYELTFNTRASLDLLNGTANDFKRLTKTAVGANFFFGICIWVTVCTSACSGCYISALLH